MDFKITLLNVAILLFYTLPGFFLVKSKLVKKEGISDYAKLLMYICQPALIIYSFNQAEYTQELLKAMFITFVFSILFFGIIIGVLYSIFHKKLQDQVRYRIYILASCFGNCGFFGIPMIEALLPEEPNAVVLASVFLLVMNIIGWSLGSMIISNDSSYLNWKKIFLNPSMIGIYIALPLFFFGIKLEANVSGAVTLLGKMTTPLCMIILGMRLATMSFKRICGDYRVYLIVLLKQVIIPLLVFVSIWFLPFIDLYVKQTLLIVVCCPVASIVLTFSELVGEGQEDAASLVLLGTFLCIITMPLVLLLA